MDWRWDTEGGYWSAESFAEGPELENCDVVVRSRDRWEPDVLGVTREIDDDGLILVEVDERRSFWARAESVFPWPMFR
jgi:hypothetical protein